MTPTKTLARVKLLLNWNHHPSCSPTHLFLPPVFTASSPFHVLLSACLLLPPGQRLPWGVGAEMERVGRAPAAPLTAPIPRSCQSPPSLHPCTCKTYSIATFQEWLYEQPDAEMLLDISKKNTTGGWSLCHLTWCWIPYWVVLGVFPHQRHAGRKLQCATRTYGRLMKAAQKKPLSEGERQLI